MVVGQRRVAALAVFRHVADGGDGARVVVVPLGTPRCDGAIVHGAAEREVSLHIEFQIGDDGPLSTPAVLTSLPIQNELIQERVPVPRRRLRVWTVRPKLRNHTRIVAARHHVGRVGLTRKWVHLVALATEVAVFVIPGRQAAVLPLVEGVQLV